MGYINIIFKRAASAFLIFGLMLGLQVQVFADVSDGIVFNYYENVGIILLDGAQNPDRANSRITLKIMDSALSDGGNVLQLFQKKANADGSFAMRLKLNKSSVVPYEFFKDYFMGYTVNGTYHQAVPVKGEIINIRDCRWVFEDKCFKISGRYMYDIIGDNEKKLNAFVTDYQENVVATLEVIAMDDGSVEFSVNPAEIGLTYDSEHPYTVTLEKDSITAATEFYYLNGDENIRKLNSVRTAENFKNLLSDENVLKSLGLDQWKSLGGEAFGELSPKTFAYMAASKSQYTSIDVLKSETNKASLLNAVKNYSDISDIANELFGEDAKYGSVFNEENFGAYEVYEKLLDDNQKSDAMSFIASTDFESYDDFTDRLEDCIVTGLVNGFETTSQLSALMDKYPYVLKTSKSLTESEKKSVIDNLPYKSTKAILEYCEKLISERREESSGGGGKGSSAGSKVNGGGTISVTAPSTNINGSQNDAAFFDDLSDFEWAREAINALYSKNIINGMGNGKFAPRDKVTREQFVKMLVTAAAVPVGGSENVFADVDKDSWYFPFVSRAANAGIVNGDENGCFGVGDSITRQDAVVMCYRTFAALKNKNAESAKPFVDEGDISEYARNAVEILSSLGIIDGMDDGRFMPLETCTRAQAAKIIYTILQHI